MFEEFNGIPGEASFKVSPNLTKRLAAVLTKPFTFEYTKGQVIDIKAAPDISNSIVNIVRGILKFLHVTVKFNQRIYELDEVRNVLYHQRYSVIWNVIQYYKICFVIISSQVGIHGICHSAYVIEENAEANELYVTQNIDIKNCHQKAEVYEGMALAQESKLNREVCILSYLKVQQIDTMKYFGEIIHIDLLAIYEV